MSTTYCREDCRTCEWVATTLEGVRPYWFCDAEGVFGDSEALRYCPACGTRLLPDGETEEMVSKRVALAAYDGQGGVMAEEMLPRHHLRPRRGL